MKIWRWLASILLSITIAFFILASFIYTPEEDSQTSSPDPQEETIESETSPEGQSQNQDPEESTVESDGALSEGLKDVFTSVIEGARDLFIRDNLRIAAVGDSLTQGVGDTTGSGGYLGILKENFNSNEENGTVEIDNYGKRGNRTDQLLERLDSEEIQNSIRTSDIVLITIGANDVMEVVKNNFSDLNYSHFVAAQKGYEDRLGDIFEKINALNPEAPIYILGLYNPFEQYFNNIPELGQIMKDWNRVTKEVVDRYEDITFIPINDIFQNSEETLLWQQDHFHPNKLGYKRIAERVLEYIREDIEQ